MLKKILAAVAGAAASYYAAKYTKQLLEEKPLKTRAREAKDKVTSMKTSAETKVDQALVDLKKLIDDKHQP